MGDYRNVWALIAAVGFLQLAGGVLGVVTPLGLEALGVDAFMVGIIAALYAAGFMAGAAGAPRALSLFGNIRVFSAAAALTASSALAMELTHHPGAWTLIRIVQGASFAWMFASAESWLSVAAPISRRGAVMAAYHVVAKAALVVGPFFTAGLSPLAARPYIWCGVFLALALIPICLTRQAQPPAPAAAPLQLARLARLAPAGFLGAFMAGVVNTGTLALLPVFSIAIAPESGSATQTAAIAMAAAWAGGLASQWPSGRLSDRMDRRVVVAILSLVAALAAFGLALPVAWVGYGPSLALLAIWGAGSLSFYGVCVAHAIDRSETDQIPRVMSGLLFVWAAGSVLGPPLSGLAMRTPMGPGGLFLLAGGLLAALAWGMVWRRRSRDAAPEADREAWELTQPTSVLTTEIDPRADV